MSIFSRYLLKNYLKVLLLCIISFIAILLMSRLEEMAHFASLGAPLSYLSLFILYQIPYILPIAIPISCLISAMILFQRLSQTHELTALRAGGLSLKQIVSPILIAGAFLSLTTFYITSELATGSHLATRKMIYNLCSINPLILLQSAKIAKLKGSYVQIEPVQNGRTAKNLLIAINNPSSKRIHLCLAKKVKMQEEELKGEQVSIISSIPSSTSDHLIIENQKNFSSPAPEFAHLLRKRGWKIANDHLKMNLLQVRKQMLQKESGKKAKLNLSKCRTEIVRRLSFGVAAFTFTLMGVSFGMKMSRNRDKQGPILALIFTALVLITFFIGKEFDHLTAIASILFLFPHILIVLASLWILSRLNRGVK